MSTPAIPIPDIGSSRDLTLFVACYNEEGGIVGTLETLLSALHELPITYDIVVIDDASKDRSVELVQEFIAAHPEESLQLIVNDVNAGVGLNFADGAFRGRGEYYRMICGDNVEPKEALLAIFKHLGEADILVPYHAYREFRGWHRRAISTVFTETINWMGGYRLKYYNGMPVCRRYDVMRWHSNAHGFGFQADLVTRLLDLGANYIEIPIVPHERTAGSTKAFTLANLCSVIHTLLDIAIRRTARLLYPHRFTRPMARRRQYLSLESDVANAPAPGGSLAPRQVG
jgi:dolichol-phosphate mannosyltransferase